MFVLVSSLATNP